MKMREALLLLLSVAKWVLFPFSGPI